MINCICSLVDRICPTNLTHVLLNNGAHDSVGGQPTAASQDSFSIPGVALASGYKNAMVASTKPEIKSALERLNEIRDNGPSLIEIKISRGARKDLGRPSRTPVQNKVDFMHFLAINS